MPKRSFEQRLKAKARVIQVRLYKCGIHKPISEVVQWMRDHPSCPLCGLYIAIPDYSVDHIFPLARGGNNDWYNLHLVHFSCNREKGTLTIGEFKDLLNYLSDKPIVKKDVLTRLKAAGFMMRRGA